MISVIITAGGSSSRFNGENKLLYKINGKPVISYSVETFSSFDFTKEIIISANISIIDDLETLFRSNPKIKIIQGGQSRQESVYNGLMACANPDFVIIHDGARPYITKDVIIKCLKNAKENSASITAVKTIDTIKIADKTGVVISTPERSTLWNAQTPQIFDYKKILEVHKQFKGKNYTDDAMLFEKAGYPVYITEGEYSNIKITTINDIH